jgi:hypothetical protein
VKYLLNQNDDQLRTRNWHIPDALCFGFTEVSSGLPIPARESDRADGQPSAL